jgi:hypothetical protein
LVKLLVRISDGLLSPKQVDQSIACRQDSLIAGNGLVLACSGRNRVALVEIQ